MINKLSLEDFSKFISGMLRVEAQEALLEISVASYPHSKKEHQQKLHKQLHTIAYPKEKKPMTLDHLDSILRTYGNGQ